MPMYESMVSFVMAEHQWGQTFEPPHWHSRLPTSDVKASPPLPHQRRLHRRTALLGCPLVQFRHSGGATGVGVEDTRFIDMKTRLQNIDQTYAITGEIMATRTTQEWVDLYGDTNVPMMVVNSPDDLITDPHLVESGYWQEMEHPTEGRPCAWPATRSILPAHPHLSVVCRRAWVEHTEEILLQAGYSAEQVSEMLDTGVARDITRKARGDTR